MFFKQICPRRMRRHLKSTKIELNSTNYVGGCARMLIYYCINLSYHSAICLKKIFSVEWIKSLFICYAIMIVFFNSWHNKKKKLQSLPTPTSPCSDSTEELLPLKTQCSLFFQCKHWWFVLPRESCAAYLDRKLSVLIWSKMLLIFIFDLLERGGTK